MGRRWSPRLGSQRHPSSKIIIRRGHEGTLLRHIVVVTRHPGSLQLLDRILLRDEHARVRVRAVLLRPRNGVAPARGNVHACTQPSASRPAQTTQGEEERERARTEPDHQTRADAECKEEREALPVVPTSVDDRLDDIRADHGRRAVREPEEAEEHVIEPRRGQLGHHRLREGVVGRLEEPEDDVVRPELPDVVEAESGMSGQLEMR